MGNMPALGCTRRHQLPGSPRGTPMAATQNSYLSLMSGTLPKRHCCLHLHAQYAYGVRWSLWTTRTRWQCYMRTVKQTRLGLLLGCITRRVGVGRIRNTNAHARCQQLRRTIFLHMCWHAEKHLHASSRATQAHQYFWCCQW